MVSTAKLAFILLFCQSHSMFEGVYHQVQKYVEYIFNSKITFELKIGDANRIRGQDGDFLLIDD